MQPCFISLYDPMFCEQRGESDVTLILCNVLPQCFPTLQISFFNSFPNKPWFLRVCSTSLLKILWEKREIARNEQFLLFPQCFLPFWRILLHFPTNYEFSSANSFSMEESNISRMGKHLRTTFTLQSAYAFNLDNFNRYRLLFDTEHTFLREPLSRSFYSVFYLDNSVKVKRRSLFHFPQTPRFCAFTSLRRVF